MGGGQDTGQCEALGAGFEAVNLRKQASFIPENLLSSSDGNQVKSKEGEKLVSLCSCLGSVSATVAPTCMVALHKHRYGWRQRQLPTREQVQCAKVPTGLPGAPSPLKASGGHRLCAHFQAVHFRRSVLTSCYQFFSVELFNFLTSCFRHYA